MNHLVHPGGSLTTGRTLAARLFVIEEREALQCLDHTNCLVHHDDRTGTEHRSAFADRVIVHGAIHDHVCRHHWSRRTTWNNSFQLATATHATTHFEQRCKRGTKGNFVVTRAIDVAGNREQLGSAVIWLAQVQELLATHLQD